MNKHIALLVFAPYGDSSSKVNDEGNKELTLELTGGYYNNPAYFGPGITHKLRHDRILSFVKENRGEDILKTHTFWYANTLKDKYEENGDVPWNDVCQCLYHPQKDSQEKKEEVVMSDAEFDDMWRNEIAMETGMLYGIDAYNDIRGY